MSETCACGHVEDKHFQSGVCQSRGCFCQGFDSMKSVREEFALVVVIYLALLLIILAAVAIPPLVLGGKP